MAPGSSCSSCGSAVQRDETKRGGADGANTGLAAVLHRLPEVVDNLKGGAEGGGGGQRGATRQEDRKMWVRLRLRIRIRMRTRMRLRGDNDDDDEDEDDDEA